MRGLGDDGRLSPETDAALQAAIGEVADEGDIVIGPWRPSRVDVDTVG